MANEKHQFEAEIGRILEIMANALYSDKEVFLRELISNASDACDKLRYNAIEKPELLGKDTQLKITISANKGKSLLVIEDNGIGMSKADLMTNIGTIAHSGTGKFLKSLGEDAKKDNNLIGQFGVGFYSVFMVAKKVEVLSRKAGEKKAHCWISTGKSGYEISESDDNIARGTRITLHLKKDMGEFSENMRLEHIIRSYSDHISIPIFLSADEDSDTKEDKQVNEATALWRRNKADITDEQYNDFYKQTALASDDPWVKLHFRTEGVIEYTGLIFIPSAQPFDLFHPDRNSKLKLYVKRVFITDDCKEILPSWLRFVRGVVDSEDLPLNISREMLQNNPVLSKIKKGLSKNILKELKDKKEKDIDSYKIFWKNFGAVLKEGLYEDFENREELLNLSLFKSLKGDDDAFISLNEYVESMAEGQKDIYYMSGGDLESLRASPQLEAFKKRQIDVLLMTDPVDEFWMPMVGKFGDHAFKSVSRGQVDLSEIGDDKEKTDKADKDKNEGKDKGKKDEDVKKFAVTLKSILGDLVSDVSISNRLTESPVCLITPEGEMDAHLKRLMRSQGQEFPDSPPILEINPDHALIQNLAKQKSPNIEICHLLLDQAYILENEPIKNTSKFAERLTALMEQSFSK